MPRSVQVTVPMEKTDALLAEIMQLPGLIGLRVQRGVSIRPPGDVIGLEVTTRALHPLTDLLLRHGVGRCPGSSFSTADPLSIVSRSNSKEIIRDWSESTWEEIELLLCNESNMNTNALLIMAASGLMAGVGLASGALDVVLGAMLIAPGFEPLSRIALGVAAGSPTWRRGLVDAARGYALLVAGALLAALLLRLLGNPNLAGANPSLQAGPLIAYWSTTSLGSVFISAAACTAGAILIATNRSVLTSGVMVALALVPSAAIFGLALFSGDMSLSARALLRWGVDVLSTLVFSGVVFAWMRRRVHKRGMIL